MRVAIAGGNGFIGRRLTELLLQAGHEVVWLSHRPGRFPLGDRLSEVPFDYMTPLGDGPLPAWAEAVAAADVVVNLSGYPIVMRWNEERKQLLRDSRVHTARALKDAISRAREGGAGPSAYIGASAVGIYGDAGDTVLAEDAPAGTDWLSQLGVTWERETFAVGEETGVRVVTVRTGLVLGDEGFLPKMALPMKLFVGGPVGSGRQWTPWIHLDDMAGIYRFVIEHDEISGPVNAVAPNPVTMRDFSKALGRALHRPSWFPVPGFGLKIVLGEVAPYMVYSQRPTMQKLLDAGYEFAYPEIDGALVAAL
ncbi:MAG: TIGR01777 family oxidoreductase [Coriobacteriia bacterium]|nr:TIGR01777 family oxidoreductase [Coriobacteriia bacterium]MBN2841199.1 TIGR01777 family oxidoreductase [Coriobacteriia bacterium]